MLMMCNKNNAMTNNKNTTANQPVARGKAPAKTPMNVSSSLSDPITHKKRKKKLAYGTEDFRRPIFKLSKTLDESKGMRMSRQAVTVLNSILLDLVHRTAEEASKLCKYSQRGFMQCADLVTAFRLVFGFNELCNIATMGGSEKLQKIAKPKNE